MTFSQTAGVRVSLRSGWLCWSVLLRRRRTFPCCFTYLGYPRKL